MRNKSELSLRLRSELIRRGYDESLAEAITDNLNTDFTAKRMLGYLREFPDVTDVDLVDEMLAILEDRNRIMKKMELEHSQAAWNEMMMYGFDEDEF